MYCLVAKLPESIGNCTNLSRLFLAKNRLTKLPAEIGNLKQLRWLDVSVCISILWLHIINCVDSVGL
jgi:hypothetical protein